MNRQKLVLVMLVIYAFAITAFIVMSVPLPIGSDTYWHNHVSGLIAKGDVAGAWNYTITENKFPYGFLAFHFLIAPLSWSGQPLLMTRILEMLLMPTTYAITLYLVYRFGGGVKPAAITGLVLLGGWAFMDGALQVRPESLDLLLYPIIVMALLTVEKKSLLLASVLTVYSHGIAALSIIYGLALSKFKDKQWKKTFIITALFILPVIILSLFYVQGAFQKWGGAPPQENPQEYEFWTTPLTFIPIYAGSMLLGIPYLFRRNKSPLELLLTWGFIGSMIMLPIWPDRWLHYSSIPLSILAGIGIDRMQGKKKFIIGVAVLMVFMFYYAMWIQMSLTGQWWQPGD
jgi:hypothetical protein